MTKRVNARRQHSHHGRGNAGLVAGSAFKPLFVPYTEFISNSKREMIKADAEDMAASLGAGSAESEVQRQESAGDGRHGETGAGGAKGK